MIGKGVQVSTKDGCNFQIVPKFWSDSMQDGTFGKVCQLQRPGQVTGEAILGICTDFQADLQEFTYMIAVEKAEDVSADGMTVKDIPALTWAVFESVGGMPNAIQQVTQRIFSEFFPSTEYEHADGPELEVYLPGDTNADDYLCEVWVPVVKR